MKSHAMTHRVFLLNPKKLLIVFLVFSSAFFLIQQKTRSVEAAGPTAIPTFNSIGVYWDPANGGLGNTTQLQYRKLGETTWRQGHPLWYNNRNDEYNDIGMAQQYRGSIVHLESGTYDIKLTLQNTGDTATLTATTWKETNQFPIAQTVYLPPVTKGTSTIDQSGPPQGYILCTPDPSNPNGEAVIDGDNNGDGNPDLTHNIVIKKDILVSEVKAQAEPGWIDLIDDPEATFEKPNIPKPNYLEPIIDPVFGTKVTRITGDPGDPIVNKDGETIGTWGTVARHWYSKVQPWNADESLIYLYFNEGGSPAGGLLLDGETYEPIKFLNLPTRRVRWHPTDPDLMIYAIGNEFGYFNVSTGKKTVLRNFPGYILTLAFMGEGNVSFDGRMALLHAYKNDVLHIFAYDLENDIVYPELDVSSFNAHGQTWTCFDWASISPSGDYIVVYRHNTQQEVYDLNMNLVTMLQWPTKHMDIGIDEEGEEVAMGHTAGWYVCNEGTVYVNGTGGGPDKYKGQLTKQRLRDGETTQLTWGDNYALSHTSARNQDRPGWVYNWYRGYADSNFRDEIVAVKTDGSFSVQRFCHLHNIRTDYHSEAHPCPSPDGRRVLFASNWDESSGRPVGAYVVDARAPGPSPTPTPMVTSTPLPTSTSTFAPTNTPTPTLTSTPTVTSTPLPIHTPTPTLTNVPILTPTSTPTPKATNTPTPTATSTLTSTPTPIPTGTPPKISSCYLPLLLFEQKR